MASIFNKTNNLFENPNRNTFDLSFQNNLTLNMGELVPVICKECLPGDTWRVDPTISLRMMPLLFPVQTRLRAHLHLFYVTNRSLWKDWMDFIGKTKESVEMPYIYNDFKTGSLGDYLGLPTTVSQGTPQIKANAWWNGKLINQRRAYKAGETGDPIFTFNLSASFGSKPTPILYDSLISDKDFNYLDFASIFDEINYALGFQGSESYIGNFGIDETNNARFYERRDGNINFVAGDRNTTFNSVVRDGSLSLTRSVFDNVTAISFCYFCPHVDLFPLDVEGNQLSSFKLFDNLEGLDDDDLGNPTKNVNLVFSWFDYKLQRRNYAVRTFSKSAVTDGINLSITGNDYRIISVDETGSSLSKIASLSEIRQLGSDFQCILLVQSQGVDSLSSQNGFGFYEFIENGRSLSVNAVESVYTSAKYYSPTSDVVDWIDENFTIKINALPFRAYEAIYNSFYRDERNNPFILDGEPVYNKFLKNYDGGFDSEVNKSLYKRNWQSDFLTTAVQSPQQGVAPLVGITARGEITFKDEETGELYTAQLNSSDGDAISSFTVTSPNMPPGNLRQLVDFASSGISISDLRGVNALQRWLEINMRRGLRYKDQIKSHFGVDVRFDELMMPEFIGGISTDIYVNQINQTAPTSGQPLGWFAGQGGAFESAKHSITHYCQEHGYIIGILSIEPTPQYSQLLPKHFLKSQLLDYFFPEFGHLGMQPILYNEVAPNESLFSGQNVNDTFGYQRAWYDYLASVDEVHGLFRTNLNNFVVQRFFDGRPELSKSFLTIDPKTLDSVFAVNSGSDSHKFLGQVYFDCKVKRPIPEYGIPKLEV